MVEHETVMVQLEACEPQELLRAPTPVGMWFRLEENGIPHGFPIVTIWGLPEVVRAFVADNWGDEVAEDTEYRRGGVTYEPVV